jgi:hypothetical protein
MGAEQDSRCATSRMFEKRAGLSWFSSCWNGYYEAINEAAWDSVCLGVFRPTCIKDDAVAHPSTLPISIIVGGLQTDSTNSLNVSCSLGRPRRH